MQIRKTIHCVNNTIKKYPNYQDIVSLDSAYSVQQLMEMARNNQSLPSLKTYDFLKSPVDLDNPLPVINSLSTLATLSSKHQQDLQQIQDAQNAEKQKQNEEKEKALREQMRNEIMNEIQSAKNNVSPTPND